MVTYSDVFRYWCDGPSEHQGHHEDHPEADHVDGDSEPYSIS